MRTFFRAHWKAIVAIVLLVLLALVTVNPSAAIAGPTLATRLRTHVDALEPDGSAPAVRTRAAAAYIDNVLKMTGYAVHDRLGAGGARDIEVAVANVAPGTRPARSFVVGARYDGAVHDDDDALAGDTAGDVAAVLELARLLRRVHPTAGTEVRFVFLLDPADIAHGPDPARDHASFIAFAGPPAAARQVQDTLAAFQGAPEVAIRGLAAPAYLQGVTVSGHGRGTPTLVVMDTAFTRFPYRHAEDDDPSRDDTPAQRIDAAAARVVRGLARTLGVLAAGQRG